MNTPTHTRQFTLNDIAAFHELRATDLNIQGFHETAEAARERAVTVRRAIETNQSLVDALEAVVNKIAEGHATHKNAKRNYSGSFTEASDIARAALARAKEARS